MSTQLYGYYDRELRFIRNLAQEFARKYQVEAGRLELDAAGRSTDPHVERLIEAFALLTANVRLKLEDEFPELTDAMLGVLYPHYLAPIPSMTLVQFELNAGAVDLPNGFVIPAGSRLVTNPVEKTARVIACRYRTGYPVTVWPVKVSDAKLRPPPFPPGLSPPDKAKAVLRIQLDCTGPQSFDALSMDSLRFFLLGDAQLTVDLYESIFTDVMQVVMFPREGKGPLVLRPEECIRPVGFERQEALLPYPNQSFIGYRLLTEFFAYPAKFAFFDLTGFDRLRSAGAVGTRVEVHMFLKRAPRPGVVTGVGQQTFRLGCTPAINLFEKSSEGFKLTQKRFEYEIVPDVHAPDGHEVFSVDGVSHTDPGTGKETVYQPFYSFRHRQPEGGRAYWYSTRRPSLREGDRGTDVFLNLVDLSFVPSSPADETVTVRLTCINRDLPHILQQAGDELNFELQLAAPVSVSCLRPPTDTLRPPLRRQAHWRLLSHLNLNHLSIADAIEGREALQEYLRLYDFADPQRDAQSAALAPQISDGILSVKSRRVVGYTGGDTASGYARGIEVTVELDDEKFAGVGSYLFACVLERFLGLYASINSFSQLVVRTRRAEGATWEWPPRAGEQPLM